MKINKKAEEGEEKVVEFVRDLVERNKVAESDREAEQERLKELVTQKIMEEILNSLPEEDLDEIEQSLDEDGNIPVEKLDSMMFLEGVRAESIVRKVFKDVEREYLGIENVEPDETLSEAGEEE